MPDISMCHGGDCPDKETCYRYKATPDKRYQIFFTAIPYNKAEEDCDMFLPIYPGDTVNDDL